MTEPSSFPWETRTRSRWRRPGTWIALVLLALGMWLLVSFALTGWHAKKASSALSAMTAQMASGDPAGAAASIETARSNTEAARQNVDSLPISALKVIPYFNTNLNGTSTFLRSAMAVLDAAEVTNQVYATLSGSDGSPQAVFANGTIQVEALQKLEPQVGPILDHLDQAEGILNEVPADISPLLRKYVDEAADQINGIQTGLRVYKMLLPEFPALLGEDRPATYLVVFHNPGELFPGGGAALNAAVVQLINGKMEVVDKGAVSTHFFWQNPEVPWDPKAGEPYYATKNATDGFAWSNLHQDYRITGEDLIRSWEANGGQPVDGVISLDPVALQAAVAASGPIDTPLYGQITADNLINKLLFEGYNEDANAQEQRHQINQQLIDEMLARMQSGSGALTIGRAIFATAGGHHIRMYLRNDRAEEALRVAHVDGAQPDPQPDRIAFFTQNQNSSKVDIFQTREVVHDVRLDSDGSASVVQTAKVTNNAPVDGGSPLTDRIGYTTRWAFHWNIVFLPENAEDVKIAANPGEIKTDDRVFTDIDGRRAVRVGRWLAPGDSSYITVSYRLPDGTFGTPGNLEYRAGVEHQLTVNPVTLTVNVTGPAQAESRKGEWVVDANRGSIQFPVTGPTTVALGFAQ